MYYKYASSELIVFLKGPAGRKSPANVSSHQVVVTIQVGDRLGLGWRWLGTGCFAGNAVSRDGWSTEGTLNPARLAAPGAPELPPQRRRITAPCHGCEQGSPVLSGDLLAVGR